MFALYPKGLPFTTPRNTNHQKFLLRDCKRHTGRGIACRLGGGTALSYLGEGTPCPVPSPVWSGGNDLVLSLVLSGGSLFCPW